MPFIENTFLFNSDNDEFILKLNKRNIITNEEIDGELIDKFIESDIFKNYKTTEDNIIIGLKMPKESSISRKAFVDGRFSEINKGDKYKILDFLFKHDVDDLSTYKKVSAILRKDKNLRLSIFKELDISNIESLNDIELRSKININEETYHATEKDNQSTNKEPNSKI